MVFGIREWLLSSAVWGPSSGSTYFSHVFFRENYQKEVCLVTFWLLFILFQPQSSPSFQTLGLECIIAARCLQSNYSLIWLVAQQDDKRPSCQAGSDVSHYPIDCKQPHQDSGWLFWTVRRVCSCLCVSSDDSGWKHGLFSRRNIPACSLASCSLIKDMTNILK